MTSVVYDPSENMVRIGGHTLTGVTSIVVQRGEDAFKVVNGIHSVYSAVVKNFKQPFKLTVKLLQTSESNSVLQYLFTSSEVLFNSFYRVEVIGQDTSHISSTCHILSAPDLSLENEAADRTWVFTVNAIDFSGLTDLIKISV